MIIADRMSPETVQRYPFLMVSVKLTYIEHTLLVVKQTYLTTSLFGCVLERLILNWKSIEAS